MKKYINKENIKILISILALLLIVLFYILSPLLNNVFNGTIVIAVTVIGFLLLAAQIVFYVLKRDKILKIAKTINEYVQVLLVAIILVEFVFTFIINSSGKTKQNNRTVVLSAGWNLKEPSDDKRSLTINWENIKLLKWK